MEEAVKPLRLERLGPLVLAGLCRSHRLPRDSEDLFHRISQQWRDFAALRKQLRPAAAEIEYGIGLRMADGGESLDYCCGVAVTTAADLPARLVRLEFSAMKCAVFQHDDHVSKLRETMEAILGTELPLAGLEPSDDEQTPEFIERYGKAFSPETGLGGLEVLIPLKE